MAKYLVLSGILCCKMRDRSPKKSEQRVGIRNQSVLTIAIEYLI